MFLYRSLFGRIIFLLTAMISSKPFSLSTVDDLVDGKQDDCRNSCIFLRLGSIKKSNMQLISCLGRKQLMLVPAVCFILVLLIGLNSCRPHLFRSNWELIRTRFLKVSLVPVE